jgi:hypothetical protein
VLLAIANGVLALGHLGLERRERLHRDHERAVSGRLETLVWTRIVWARLVLAEARGRLAVVRSSRERLRARSAAQGLVEWNLAAAVSFPLLVLLLPVIREAALYVHALHVVLGAAREGAHAAAAEHATIEHAVEDGRARAREVLEAGLGQYAASIQVVDPALDDGSVLVEVRGGMPLFFGGPGQDSPGAVAARCSGSRLARVLPPASDGGY